MLSSDTPLTFQTNAVFYLTEVCNSLVIAPYVYCSDPTWLNTRSGYFSSLPPICGLSRPNIWCSDCSMFNCQSVVYLYPISGCEKFLLLLIFFSTHALATHHPCFMCAILQAFWHTGMAWVQLDGTYSLVHPCERQAPSNQTDNAVWWHENWHTSSI